VIAGREDPGGFVGSVENVTLWRRTIQKLGLVQEMGVVAVCGRPRAVLWHRSVRVRWGH
jgi:hypothetical protein